MNNLSNRIYKSLKEAEDIDYYNKYIKETGDGLVFIDDDGKQYDLLEGICSNGKTSDIVFVFDYDGSEGGSYVTHFWGGLDSIPKNEGELVKSIKASIDKYNGKPSTGFLGSEEDYRPRG